jgi:thioredoxin-like negative regulator of GroEL
MTKVLEEMDLPFPVEKVNIDVERDAALEYGIRGIPHMILLDENHNIITRIGGVATKQQLIEAFEIA